MRRIFAVLFFSTLLPVGAAAQAAADAKSIHQGISGLRSLSEAQRGTRTGELARQIDALPAGPDKLHLAIGLSHLSTEGDAGRDNLQAVTTTLANALAETPTPPEPDIHASPYFELAELARYEHMSVPASATGNAQYKAAMDKLAAEDDEVNKQNFTLKDVNGKKWTLKDLRGKVVLVTFWATWCPPCRQELPNLEGIAAHFANDLVVLAISDEDLEKVNGLFHGQKTSFVLLLDPARHTEDAFHVTGIPRTFVFDREGKLAAEAIDGRTQHQFLQMLASAGLKM